MPTRGPNNTAMAERLGRQLRFVTNVRDDADAATLLGKRGYDADEIARGIALHSAAQAAYGGRDAASGALAGARKTLATADRDARRLMGELRNTLRALYDGQPEHLTALGVTRDRQADDRDTFLTESRATLAAVHEAPYAAEAAAAGQDTAAVEGAGDAVEALASVSGAEDAATGGRAGSTSARDAAYSAFQAWLERFRRFVRIALKDHPDVAARIKA